MGHSAIYRSQGAALANVALLVASANFIEATPATAAPQSGNPPSGSTAGSNVVASPLTLTPAFDPSITDYVVRCEAGSTLLNSRYAR